MAESTDGTTPEAAHHATAEPSINSTQPTVDTCLRNSHDDVIVTATAVTSEEALASPTSQQNSNQHVEDSCTFANPVANEVGASVESHIQADTTQAARKKEHLAQSCPSEDPPLILYSLSIDSFHCVASFLAPTDWASFGLASKGTNRVVNQVFRRVRMHGFRCATEVVAAWKLGQLADARELTALYTKKGVPIYPHSLGHSYHTLVWRMGIEAREMAGSTESAQGGIDDAQRDERSNNRPIDRFYSERYDERLNDGPSDLTYLEQKCVFWYQQKSESGEGGRGRRSINALVPPPPILQAHGHAPGDGLDVPARLPDFRPAANDQSLDGQRGTSGSASPSFSELKLAHTPRLVIRVHRHLVDQHLLGLPIVDDENGAMRTAPTSLSADFYHPYIAGQASSSTTMPSNEISSVTEEHSELPQPMGTSNVAALQSFGSGIANNGEHSDGDGNNRRVPGFDSSAVRTPTDFEAPLLSPPPLYRSPVPEMPPRIEHPMLANVDLDIYSSASVTRSQSRSPADENNEIRDRLRTRFAAYQCRLDLALADRDNQAIEECMLDFWDDFLPTTANIHFYDRYTAVPRVSCLQKFLTKPCPKAIGIVQCEIERIRVHPKKKGVNMKGRLFPSYEYRLFIRDRRHSSGAENLTRDPTEEPRKDTVLMTAKNRGKKHRNSGEQASASQSSKKGVNNYYIFTPQHNDVDAHYNAVNEMESASTKCPNGASCGEVTSSEDSPNGLLARLQSNFIGTEFQIFSQSVQKHPARRSARHSLSAPTSDSENDFDHDSIVSSDNLSTSSSSQRRGRFRRRSKKPILHRRSSDSNIDHPQPIEEESSSSFSPEGRRLLQRAMSMPGTYSRSSRTSRRAIAHAIEPTESQLIQPFYFCEKEEGAITYTANLLGNRPRIMDVCIPKVSSDGVAAAEWNRYLESCSEENDGSSSNKMLTCFKQLQHRLENPNQLHDENIISADDDYVPPDDFGLLALQNRPPWWNIELGAFVLNFGGRVSVASVKNFQLCDRGRQDHIMLQFGRIQGRHSFTMDFQHPLTAVQAFAIAISSLQSKISFG